MFKEFKTSIKSPDTEEKLDLILYRPCGFIIAKLANSLTMTPSMLSLIGLFLGILSSYYYFWHQNNWGIFYASSFLILSGIFDSADGQLARLSNQSSQLGLVLDGICDSLVTIFVYFACAAPFIIKDGLIFVPIVCIALYLHSCQCAILDFYHREYLYFGYGKTENNTYWNPGVEDAKLSILRSQSVIEKQMNKLRLTWIRKQQLMTSRSDKQRQAMKKIILHDSSEKKDQFMQVYRRNNLWILPFWRLVGVNAHTILIIVFMFFHRFDMYLITCDLLVFNLIIVGVALLQKRSDLKFFSELNLQV